VDEEIFVGEAGTVELKTSEGSSSFGQSGSGVAVGMSVAVAEAVELRVPEGSYKLSEVAAVAGPP